DTRFVVGSQTLFAKAGAGDPNGLTIGLNGDQVVASLGGHTIMTSSLVAPGTWYHLAFTFGAGGMQLYLHGVLVGSDTYTGGLTANRDAIVIGASNATSPMGATDLATLAISSPFDGRIDEVAIYNIAVPIEQVHNFMQKGPLGGSDPNG